MKRLLLILFLLCAFPPIAKAQNQCGIMADGDVGTPWDQFHLAMLVIDKATGEQHVKAYFKPVHDSPCEWTVDLPLPQSGRVIGLKATDIPETWPVNQNGVRIYIFFEDGKVYVASGLYWVHPDGSRTCHPYQGWSNVVYDFNLSCSGPVSTDRSTWGTIKGQVAK